MGKTTSIEWTRGEDGSEGATWTAIRARNTKTGKIGWHCEHDSPGCLHCYSEAQNKWTGTGLDFKPGHLENGDVELFLDLAILQQPTTWGPTTIFVCSMTDLFGRFVHQSWIDAIFAVMALTADRHKYMILTKRQDRMLEYLRDPSTPSRVYRAARNFAGDEVTMAWPMSHVRVGVSIEDQRRATERFDPICDVADLGWDTMISAEPLLEQITVPERYLALGRRAHMIMGGESGRDARPCALRNFRVILRSCFTRITAFVKQLGAHPIEGEIEFHVGRPMAVNAKELKLIDKKGGDINEFPLDLRVRELPK